MNRTDRLYALVEELRARSPRLTRAAELARRFEVTTRTVERDLLALQESGVPIWAQPGPGGGYTLDPKTTLPPLNLTPAEATAIAVALSAAPAMPFAEAGKSALQKLVAVMSEPQLTATSVLASRVRVTDHGMRRPDGGVAQVVEQALSSNVAIEIEYEDRDRQSTRRTIEPVGIVGTKYGWYLMAWCRLRQATRAFRLDRVRAARLLAERCQPRSLESMLQGVPFAFLPPPAEQLTSD